MEFLIQKLKIINESVYIRQLLDKSLSEEMIEVLFKQIENKQISAWKAAEIAGILLRKMLEELKKRNISKYNEQYFNEDLKFALE